MEVCQLIILVLKILKHVFVQVIPGLSNEIHLIQVAKSFKANSIIVIDDRSETFSIKEDLGKIII